MKVKSLIMEKISIKLNAAKNGKDDLHIVASFSDYMREIGCPEVADSIAAIKPKFLVILGKYVTEHWVGFNDLVNQTKTKGLIP